MDKYPQDRNAESEASKSPIEMAEFVEGTNAIPDDAFSLGRYQDEYSPTDASEVFVGYHGSHWKVVRDPKHQVSDTKQYPDQYPGMI